MDGRFRAFSFVDRITRLEPGSRIEGHYTVPAGAAVFPALLMAEAVGQLAAWSAMDRLDYTRRPVAGLAGETRYHGRVTSGQTLQLAADIERCDDEAIAYGGTAAIDGTCVLELFHCVGPMLPMTDFDDPTAVRADFETLRERGAPADRFGGVEPAALDIVEHVAGERLRAALQVPASAPYFDDHFPRRPVYPGTLLMEALSGLALQLARDLSGFRDTPPVVASVHDVKIRSFTSPGQALALTAEVLAVDAGSAQLKLAARAGDKPVATARIAVARSSG